MKKYVLAGAVQTLLLLQFCQTVTPCGLEGQILTTQIMCILSKGRWFNRWRIAVVPLGQEKPSLKRGFTIIELLVTIAIIVTIAGLSFGALIAMARSTALDREIQEAAAPFLAVPATAERTRSPAFIIVNPAENTLVGYGMQVESAWHFEIQDVSAYPLAFEGYMEEDVGFAGNGIMTGFLASEDLQADITPIGCAKFQPDRSKFVRGGYFECYVNTATQTAEQVLFHWGNSIEFKITGSGRLEGHLGSTTIRNERVIIATRRWTRLAFLFCEAKVAVFLDGAVTAEDEPAEYKTPKDDEAQMSSMRSPIRGWLDEARLASLRRLANWKGSAFRIKGDKPFTLWYSEDGSLNPDVHAAPVEILLENQEDQGRDTIIRIDLNGEATRLAKKG